MGHHTHDFALSHGMSSYPGMENFVFTCSKPAGKRDGVEYLSGEPSKLIAALRKKPGKDISCAAVADLLGNYSKESWPTRLALP